MNIMFRLRSKVANFLTHLLATSLLVCAAGIAPAMAADVTVDQSPLIIQRSLPPNLVLMLDDSGSMDYDYMPDWGYMTSSTGKGSPTDDQARNSTINGTYYNPAVTYTPPPKADGTSYPDSPGLTGAYKDGFRDTNTTDVTNYTGKFPYYTRFSFVTTSTYAASTTCASGDTLQTSGTYKGQCQHSSGGRNPTYTYYKLPTCDSGDTLSGTQCTKSTTSYKYFFTYTTGSGNVAHYVGVTGDCAALPAAQQAVCDDSAATQRNVANWFSYYRTRILMAKSGLMNSFSTLDKTFRVGFGSIDGGGSGNKNYTNLPSSRYSYSDSYNGGTNYIAQIQPFGDGSNSDDQKSQFWNWVAKATASGGTPLRQALDAVGSYYQTAQPWKGMSSDPDYTTAAADTQLACRQSYTILTTDGFWNESFSGVGDADGSNGSTIKGTNNQSYAYSPVAPYTDYTSVPASYSATQSSNTNCQSAYKTATGSTSGYLNSYYNTSTKMCAFTYTKMSGTSNSNTLADVAMKYWMTDLQPGMANEVPTNAEDPAYWQHMTTFTLGMGFDATDGTGTVLDADRMASIFAWANGNSSKAISGFSWPKPAGD